MLDTEWLKGVTTNDTHHMVVRELAEEVERLRADWGAALDTMSFLRDDLTKARTEAERLRARLSDAERNLEDAGRWANQARNLCASIVGMADAYKSYSALAGTEAEVTE